MRSRPVLFLAFLAVTMAIALPARAVADDASSLAPRDPSATMQLFGSFSPGVDDESRMGVGVAFRYRLSSRVGVSLDATPHFGPRSTLTPMGFGLVVGPRPSGTVRPWFELGATYVRVSQKWDPAIVSPALSPGWDAGRVSGRSAWGGWGGYFGAGVESAVTDRVGMFGSLRVTSWDESEFRTGWDGIVAIRSGMTYGF